MDLTTLLNRCKTWAIPAVFLLAVALRLVSLDADPPATVGLHFISDEGWWVHNARNKYLFDEWILDEFNQSLLASPTFCIATYGMYNLFGVSYGSSRMVPVLSGLLTILLFSGLLYAHSPPASAFIGSLLFSCNFGFVSLNRIAYVDSTAIMFLILSWWLMDKLHHRVWAVFLAGMSFALAVVTKSYMLSVLPAAVIVMAYHYACNRKAFSAKILMLNSFLFAGGLLAVCLLWRKYLYIPFFDDYRLMYSLWQDGNFPGSLREAIRNVPSFLVGRQGSNLIPARFFGLNATLLILATLRVLQVIRPKYGSLKKIWRRIPLADRECILFLIVTALQIAPLTAKPFRRYLLLYFPLVILASRTVLPVSVSRSNPDPDSRIARLIRFIIRGSVTITLAAPFVTRAIRTLFHINSQTVSFIAASFFLLACIALTGHIRFIRLNGRPLPIAIVLIVFLLIDGGLHTHAFMSRTYTLRDTSRRLGETYLQHSSVILGGIAHSLCLENQARAIALWGREEAPRVLNQDPIRRFSPDYVVIMRRLDGLDWGREERYDRYAVNAHFLETIELLPASGRFRVVAELYRAPSLEPETQSNPRLLVSKHLH